MDWVVDQLHSFIDYIGQVGGDLLSFTWSLLVAVAILVGINWLGGRTRSKLHKRFPKRVESNPAASALADNLFRIFIFIIGIVLALGVSGVPTSSLVTWIGVIVAALSISLQSIIQNLVAGFYLLIEQPFTIGDRITVRNQTGSVQSIAMRITVMRNSRHEMVMIPNYIVFTEAVQAKLGLAPECLTLNIQPIRTAPDLIEEEVFGILRGVIGNADPKPTLTIDSINSTGMTIILRMWLTDIDRQQNEVIAALHAVYPDATVRASDDGAPIPIVTVQSQIPPSVSTLGV